MKRKRRAVACVLAVILCITMLAACSKTQQNEEETMPTQGVTNQGTEDTNKNEQEKEELKPVTLTIWLPGSGVAKQEKVMNTFCQKYMDQLGIEKIVYNYADWGDYSDKMVSLAASGDNFDACFVADWAGYDKLANNNALLPLNDLIREYAPKLLESYENMGLIKACSIGDNLVALPWTTEKSSKRVIYWRQDIADKYGIDTSNIATVEDLDRMFSEVLDKVDMPILYDTTGLMGALYAKYGYDQMNYHDITYKLEDNEIKLVPVEQTEVFKEAVTWGKKWYENGKNALSNSGDPFLDGEYFAKYDIMEKALVGLNFNIEGATYGYAELYPDGTYRKDSPLNNALAINRNSKNPERVLMLLELLNSDQDAYDMFMYGILGETYNLSEDGSVLYPDGEDATNSSYLGWNYWAFVRKQFDRPSGNYTREYLDNMSKWLSRESLVVAPLTGFMPQTDTIKTELAQRDQLMSVDRSLLLFGAFEEDVDTAVQAYIDAQNNVGLDKILEYLQKEANEFVK